MLVKECHCQRHIVTQGNSECSLCLSEKFKFKRLQERQQKKQAKTLEKNLERSRGSKTAIKPVSKKQSQEQAELTRIKKELTAINPVCFSCEENAGSTLSHIISRKHKEFCTDKRNLVLECVFCHMCWENEKLNYSILFPDKWRQKLLRVWEMDKVEFYKLADKAE